MSKILRDTPVFFLLVQTIEQYLLKPFWSTLRLRPPAPPQFRRACVRVATEKLKAAQQKYERRPTRNLQREITQAQVNLDDTYSTATTTYIQEEIDKNSGQHTAKLHDTAWKTINNHSGRKENSQSGLKEERKKSPGLDNIPTLLFLFSPRVL